MRTILLREKMTWRKIVIRKAKIVDTNNSPWGKIGSWTRLNNWIVWTLNRYFVELNAREIRYYLAGTWVNK